MSCVCREYWQTKSGAWTICREKQSMYVYMGRRLVYLYTVILWNAVTSSETLLNGYWVKIMYIRPPPPYFLYKLARWKHWRSRLLSFREYCISGNIREILIFANFARRSNSRIQESRENYHYNSATGQNENSRILKSQNQKLAKI